MRAFIARFKFAVRRATWRLQPPTALQVVALIGRLGVGTVEDFAQHFNINPEKIGKLFQEALQAKLISQGRHLRIKQEVFLPTEGGLRLAAQEGLLREDVSELGPCRIGPRTVLVWIARMRFALEFERLGMQVLTTQELRAEQLAARALGVRTVMSTRKLIGARGHRGADLKVRSKQDGRFIDVNLQFGIPISKRGRRELARSTDGAAIWITPIRLSRVMQHTLWNSQRDASIGLGLKSAVKAAGGGMGNVVVPLDNSGRSILQAKRVILGSPRVKVRRFTAKVASRARTGIGRMGSITSPLPRRLSVEDAVA
jgi:hypothetical protein